MNIIYRVQSQLKKIVNARRFGVNFIRCSTFKTPNNIQINGKRISISAPDEFGVKNDFMVCFLDDQYGLAKIDIPVKTIIDIGGNVGFFSTAARSHFPDATIHSYEPNPRILSSIRHQGKVADFMVYEEAVGATAGIVYMEELGDSNLGRTVLDTSVICQGIPQVAFSTVIERIGGNVDLAKVDCEGAEWDLFLAKDVWRAVRLLRMEYHLWGQRSYSDVTDAMASLQFRIVKHVSSDDHGLIWAVNERL